MKPDVHDDVKCSVADFEAVKSGERTSELLDNVNQYSKGDYVLLRGKDRGGQIGTLMLEITDVLSSSTGLVSGHVVVSFKLLS